MMAERLGFVGLGIMGGGMAANLLRAGHAVTVWNRTPERAKDALGLGATWAESPAAVARACDIVFVCVSDTPDVEAVLFGEKGVVKGGREGMLLVDHSTISPGATRRFAQQLEERGMRLLDAPVSGGSEGARNGTLSIMCGGQAEDFERARPYLESMGKRIVRIGESGAGQACKMVNQVLAGGSMLLMAEALVLAAAEGLDLEKTLEAVSSGAAGSWTLTNRGPQVLARDFRPGFRMDLQYKDLRIVMQEAEEKGVPLLATGIATQLYANLIKEGHGGEGNHAIVRALEKLSGVTVKGQE
jgi:3-hydroxyisobutyrate dehydrogenase